MTVFTGSQQRARVLAAQRPKKGRGAPPNPIKRRALELHSEGKTFEEIVTVMGPIEREVFMRWVRDSRRKAAVSG